MNKLWFKCITIVSVAVFIMWLLPINTAVSADRFASYIDNNKINEKVDESPLDISYQTYLETHRDAGICSKTFDIPVADYSSGKNITVKTGYEGVNREVLLTSENSIVEWTVNIPSSGLYTINVTYFPMPGSGNAIQRSIFIDGKLPFVEANTISFNRIFVDDEKINHKDGKNDLRPSQIESFQWLNSYVKDTLGFNSDNLKFYFSTGIHKLMFKSLSQPMAISSIKLESISNELKDYNTVLAEYKAKGVKEVKSILENGIKKVQAEETYQKSDKTLYPINDNSSPANEPYSYSNLKINAIGGTKWQNQGQWISWQILVPETGLYQIGYRSKQNFIRDIDSVRSLYIDGKIPFKEAATLNFNYHDKWVVSVAGNDKPYLFYLEKGTRTIKMEITLGKISNSLTQASGSLSLLNEANWELLTLMGNTPDLYRDYNIDKYMPHVITTFREQALVLQSIADEWVKMTGKQDSNVAQINQLVYQLNEMSQKPEKIPKLFLTFRDNLSNFANMLMNAKQQPLELDYLFIAEQGAKLPEADVDFISSVKYGFLKFFISFFVDYNNLSDKDNTERAKKPVKVWIGNGLLGGRDQAITLNNLALQNFTSKTNIPVTLEIIPQSTILTATVAGKGPDVALQINGSDPVNYAMRHAVEDLSKYSEYSDVIKRFNINTLTPYTYLGGVYALPETFSFPVMFYRKDILNKLGIDIDTIKTWQDIIEILPIIQRKNMNISIPANFNSYYMFLFQMGGTLYKNENKKSNLDAKINLDAFDYWMNFYTNYNLPVVYNFVQRFRTGEIPIGIDDYTQYNLLHLSAPEINGKWGITTIPGIKSKNGKINNIAPITGSGCVLMSASKNKQNAWKFMKWYTESDTQYKFGQELESVMGIGASYNSANLNALYQLPWQVSEKQTLINQINYIEGVPEVPGGYLTARNILFALNTTYNTKADARNTLLSYVDQINQEISLKRKEFHLE